MNEEDTFNKLKQIPLDDMLSKISDIKRPNPAFGFPNGKMIQRQDYYPDIVFHHERVRCLNENGWSFEEFGMALEKRAVLDMIKEFNCSIEFPEEIIERAKRFYPNAHFTPAKIDLGHDE